MNSFTFDQLTQNFLNNPNEHIKQMVNILTQKHTIQIKNDDDDDNLFNIIVCDISLETATNINFKHDFTLNITSIVPPTKIINNDKKIKKQINTIIPIVKDIEKGLFKYNISGHFYFNIDEMDIHSLIIEKICFVNINKNIATSDFEFTNIMIDFCDDKHNKMEKPGYCYLLRIIIDCLNT